MDDETSDRSRYLAIEKTNRELEVLVYSVSHDLKSPLIALLGYLDYFKQDYGDSLPDEARFFLDRMSATGAYMQALVQDLLKLSQVGRTEIDPEAVDLSSVLDDVSAEIRSGHTEISVDVGPLPVLWMNPVRARQLLTNLVGNAVDHAGRAQVSVRVSSEPRPDGAVVLVVEDDGPGIPVEDREKVFAVFERLDAAGDGDHGTGIGLAICRRIMEHLGGSIWLDDPEQGTRICALFPPAAVHRHPHASAPGAGR